MPVFICRLTALLGLLGMAPPVFAAAPAITSASTLDLYYNVENPSDLQFAFRVVATGEAVSFAANGLPPNATFDRSTGWITGSRNFPGRYAVAVRATNAEGSAETTLHLAIHPTAISVRSSPGVFEPGQNIRVTVSYNAAVVVAGTPQLTLAIGPTDAPVFRAASYVSGSGTQELVFQYSIAAGDDDPDGVQLLPAAPSGGTISDVTGLSVSPYLPVRYFTSGITIAVADTTSNTVVSNAMMPAPTTGQLRNVSSRMRVVEGDVNRALIAGFVVSGPKAKRVLLRGIGPALRGFGVDGTLPDPRLELYSSAGKLVTDNDNWAGSETSTVAAAVGAFSLSPGARDSAVTVTLPPGAYTLVVSPNGGEGVALAEIYDADAITASGSSSISNLSTRGRIDAGGSPLIAGFSVHGPGARRMLVRGIGPTLAAFGVNGALGDPKLAIYRDGQLIAENDNWTSAAAENSAAATASGAFALGAESKDAAIVLTLEPGSYSAVVSGATETSGTGLVEVYELTSKN